MLSPDLRPTRMCEAAPRDLQRTRGFALPLLQARGEPLGLHLALLLAAMRGEELDDLHTHEAVEELRRLTPAPRPGVRLLVSLSVEGRAIRTLYMPDPHGIDFGYRTQAVPSPCVITIGEPVAQYVTLDVDQARTLHDIAWQVEAQTIGITARVNEARRCVEVYEGAYDVAQSHVPSPETSQ